MEKKHFRIADILSISLSVITLFTVVSAGFLWFHKTNALPNRVAKTEQRLDDLEDYIIRESDNKNLNKIWCCESCYKHNKQY